MPFLSKAQRRYFYARLPDLAEKWEGHTRKGKRLPERKRKPKRVVGNVNPLLIDPTRTGGLFARFAARLKRDLKNPARLRTVCNELIEASYRAGLVRAYNQVRRRTVLDPGHASLRAEFVRNQTISLGGPPLAEVIGFLQAQTFTHLAGITAAMSDSIRQALIDGTNQGLSHEDIAQKIATLTNMTEQRALLIARSEGIRAFAEGTLSGLQAMGVEQFEVAVEFSTARDTGVCPICSALQGKVYKIAEARGLIPRHPRCVLPGNLVQGRITAALKAFYSGEAVEILTLNGCRVSLTVNHPVLSRNGFVAAGKIKKGDYLIGYQAQPEVFSNAGEENGPTLIEDVFQSFHTPLFEKSCAGFDFNGDEQFMMGKVKVVTPNLPFVEFVPLERKGINKVFFVPSSTSSMSGIGLRRPLLRSHSAPFQSFGFASASQVDACVLDAPVDSSTAGSQAVGDGFGGFPIQIAPANFFGVDCQTMPRERRFGHAAELDIPFRQPAPDSIALDAQLATKLVERFPGEVTLDKVVDVRRFHYSGPVYDVETATGYFTSSKGGLASIIIRNCRCAWVPKLPESITGEITPPVVVPGFSGFLGGKTKLP